MQVTPEEKALYMADLKKLQDQNKIEAYMEQLASEQERLKILKEAIVEKLADGDDISQEIKTQISNHNNGEIIRNIYKLISSNTSFTQQDIQKILDAENTDIQTIRTIILNKLTLRSQENESPLQEEEQTFLSDFLKNCSDISFLNTLKNIPSQDILSAVINRSISLNTAKDIPNIRPN